MTQPRTTSIREARRKHQLENEIRRLEMLPENRVNLLSIKKLKNELKQLNA